MGAHTNCRWVRAICDRCTISNLIIQSRLGVETDLRALLYSHLTKLSFSYFDRTQSGQVISRANSDIRSIQVLLAFGPLIGMSIISFILASAS
ncbi:MAG: hypothetical protein CM15mP49_09980 [Actinomycetota bacterium]|nr:MAG: hypothetical protein CM15mP49_09980 [Actinomycetota bacterium]